jgi:hypothetical protein
MDIYIKYGNLKKILNVHKYQSVKSIINKFLVENKLENDLNKDIDNFFLDYNGNYLDGNYCLEKYNIHNIHNVVLTLNSKNKGGNSFVYFFMNNPLLALICLVISIIPVFILPIGFIPATSALIKIIIEKSIITVGRYLVCVLGKKTLFNRMQYLITFIKYVIFFLMIYVLITFPLIILCITMKGHSVLDNPKSMCKPINMGNTAGMILTFMFIILYGFYRIGNNILEFFINIFKKVYFLNTTINPILTSLLNLFNTSKYMPIGIIPMIGPLMLNYFMFLTVSVNGFQLLLTTVVELGCKTNFSKDSFVKLLNKKVNESVNSGKIEEEKPNIAHKDIEDILCVKDLIKCCNEDNFILIGDSLKMFVENQLVAMGLKAARLYPSFILFTEGFYEFAISQIDDTNNIPKEIDKRTEYFKDILKNSSNLLSNETVKKINEYLNTFNGDLLPEIRKYLDKNLPTNKSKIDSIKAKLQELESFIIEYSIKDQSVYVPGPSIIKIVLTSVFLTSFCNLTQTSKTTLDVISEMGHISNVTDMLKAGAASGLFTSIAYFITVIILIILGIFNKY